MLLPAARALPPAKVHSLSTLPRVLCCARIAGIPLRTSPQVARDQLGPLGKLHSKVAEALEGWRRAPDVKELFKFKVLSGCSCYLLLHPVERERVLHMLCPAPRLAERRPQGSAAGRCRGF